MRARSGEIVLVRPVGRGSIALLAAGASLLATTAAGMLVETFVKFPPPPNPPRFQHVSRNSELVVNGARPVYLVVNTYVSLGGPSSAEYQPTARGSSALAPIRELEHFCQAVAQGAPFDLVEATRQVHRGTTHCDDRRVRWSENWLQWLLGKVYTPMGEPQSTSRLLHGGCGDCSERAQILKSIVESAGRKCRFVGLTGHVVLEVETGPSWSVADPDFGIVIPRTVAALEQPESVPVLRSAMEEAGYPESTVEEYVSFYQTSHDNKASAVGSSLSPRLRLAEGACGLGVWVLPLALMGWGVRPWVTPQRLRWLARPFEVEE